ncbi:MAG: hypothetical protein RLZZ401_2136, partial [Pseudomonadota bacterium]
MSQRLRQAWLRRGGLAWLLWPVSWLYATLAWLHKGLYSTGLLARTRVGVPVLVVGNMVAGGAGKTPVVMALAIHLQAQGWRLGIISRGHGRMRRDCVEVLDSGLANEVGDEPLLLKQRCKAPVFVAPRRADAAQALLNRYPDTQLILSDDGLQHHAMAHDLRVCVFDERGTGNGFMLPAGPLRERSSAVDWILYSGQPPHSAVRPALGAYPVRRRLAEYACHADGSQQALHRLRGQALHAVAGIAKPETFFHMLRAAGLNLVQEQGLPDHYDFASWKSNATMQEQLICTEKDAVKLW